MIGPIKDAVAEVRKFVKMLKPDIFGSLSLLRSRRLEELNPAEMVVHTPAVRRSRRAASRSRCEASFFTRIDDARDSTKKRLLSDILYPPAEAGRAEAGSAAT